MRCSLRARTQWGASGFPSVNTDHPPSSGFLPVLLPVYHQTALEHLPCVRGHASTLRVGGGGGGTERKHREKGQSGLPPPGGGLCKIFRFMMY